MGHRYPPPPLKPTNAFNLEVFDSSGGFLGYKTFKPIVDRVKNINAWIKNYDNKKAQATMGFMENPTPDFQNNNFLCVLNQQGTRHNNYFGLTLTNLLIGAIYFSIRHCIKATWQNDRDQFYAPYDDTWQDDSEFKNNCLIFMLFHTQNRITTTQGTNHFIPFNEDEVNAKERYSSHALLDFLKGGIKEGSDSLFLNDKKENKPLKFSPSASRVFDAGKEIYRYYHTQDFANRPYNANASLYDIKEFFQGRNAQGKLNLPAKAKDEYYKQLYANLQDALKDLAKEIQPKVYEYGFLRE
ncbi:nucleoside 5-triphosphatase RdgB (dHAPTP, dITP,XTP-specific) [Helicobacter pylori]|nr:nucleoside 5-triphosphatase RdgB (dHAPTP, dITP,XTP-specific) [Helicobacter pylori]